jgi:hypothetical protein
LYETGYYALKSARCSISEYSYLLDMKFIAGQKARCADRVPFFVCIAAAAAHIWLLAKKLQLLW